MFSSFKDSTFKFEGLYLKLEGPLKASNLCPNSNRPLKNEKFMPREPFEVRNLHPNTNRPLKEEKFMLKTQIIVHDSHKHNHTSFAKTNTQDTKQEGPRQNEDGPKAQHKVRKGLRPKKKSGHKQAKKHMKTT